MAAQVSRMFALSERLCSYYNLLICGSHTPAIEVASQHRQPTLAHCASLSTQRVRPSPSFSGCWSDGLELTARWTQRSGVWCWQLQTVL